MHKIEIRMFRSICRQLASKNIHYLKNRKKSEFSKTKCHAEFQSNCKRSLRSKPCKYNVVLLEGTIFYHWKVRLSNNGSLQWNTVVFETKFLRNFLLFLQIVRMFHLKKYLKDFYNHYLNKVCNKSSTCLQEPHISVLHR